MPRRAIPVYATQLQPGLGLIIRRCEADHVAGDVGHGCAARNGHAVSQLVPQHLHHTLDARSAIPRQTPQHGAADEHGTRPERKRLQAPTDERNTPQR